MKSIKYFLLVIVVAAFFSCEEKMTESTVLSEQEKDLIIDEALQASVIDDLLNDIDIYSELGEGWLKSGELEGRCPMVYIEKPGSAPFWPRTITLDFGEGCLKHGKTKSGKMMIEKSAPWRETGAKRKVTFEDYVVDEVSFEGEKILTNITEEGQNPTFKIEANLTVRYSNKNDEEVTVTRVISKTQEWLAGYRKKDVRKQMNLSGTVEIVKKVGEVEKTISKSFESIAVVAGCKFPQSGITKFEVNTFKNEILEFVLDYSTEGEAGEKCRENCDCIATLISGNDSEDVDLSKRWLKRTKDSKNDK